MAFLFFMLIGGGGVALFNTSAGDVIAWPFLILLLGWYTYVGFAQD